MENEYHEKHIVINSNGESYKIGDNTKFNIDIKNIPDDLRKEYHKKYIIVNSSGKSYIIDCDKQIDTTNEADKCIHYNEIDYHMEKSAISNIENIPDNLRNEYCITFGERVLFHSKNFREAILAYEKNSKYLCVGFYIPPNNFN